jgi:predicted phage-related endonuclease
MAPPEVTAAMAHGTKLEPQAREAYEHLTGHVMEPLVLVEGEYSASLDGITLDGELLLEIKCPKAKESRLLAEVKTGRVPVHVFWQMQTQLLVSGAALAHLYVFDGTAGILLEQKPELDAWETIRRGWDHFMELIRTDQPPPLAGRDTVIRTDTDWEGAASEYIALKQAAETATELLDAAKQRLVALASHTSETGGGVTVTRYWKSGPIDYKKIPELSALDLEQYRGPLREETRVTTT